MSTPNNDVFDTRHYWFTWRLLLTLGPGLLATTIMGLVILSIYDAIPGKSLPWYWWIFLPLLITGVFALFQTGFELTAVTSDYRGIWIRFFFRRRFILWRDIDQMMYEPYMGHVVYFRYKGTVNFFSKRPLLNSFVLHYGLANREDLFWEIYRRASQVQGSEIVVKDWQGREIS